MFSERYTVLHPYVPGEQPKDRPFLKLNANENPYPPAPAVREALASFDILKCGVYPDPDSTELRQAIAAINGVSPEMVFVGNGSDEVLSLVFFAFFNSDRPVLFPFHSYSFYPVYAGYYNIPFYKVPLLPDFSIDTHAFIDTPSSGVIFPNPNAPTGILLQVDQIRQMLELYPKDKMFVVDEAYIDFGGQTVVSLLKDFQNLAIIRTFSKSGCFAGMRLGYAIANPLVIQALTTTKNSFNHFPVDAITQTLGIAVCKNWDYYKDCARKIAATRDSFATRLIELGWNVLPSSANFVFASKKGYTGDYVYKTIRDSGILIRYFDHPGITDFVRITIGTPDHMDLLATVISEKF